MTVRDDVWDAVLTIISEQGVFQLSDLDFEEGQRHTVRRVANEMQDMGWLYREDKYQKTWYAGSKSLQKLRFSDKAKVALMAAGQAELEHFE